MCPLRLDRCSSPELADDAAGGLPRCKNAKSNGFYCFCMRFALQPCEFVCIIFAPPIFRRRLFLDACSALRCPAGCEIEFGTLRELRSSMPDELSEMRVLHSLLQEACSAEMHVLSSLLQEACPAVDKAPRWNVRFRPASTKLRRKSGSHALANTHRHAL